MNLPTNLKNPNAFQADLGVHNDANTAAISIRCPHCRELGSFDVVRNKAIVFHKSIAPNGVLQFIASIRICPNTKCRGLVFTIEYGATLVEVEPPQLIDFTLENLPDQLQLTLKEAIACHGAGAYRAAAMMVRRLLEEICEANKAAGQNLHTRLAALKGTIVLPDALFEAMNELKALGNDAAHIEAKAYDNIGAGASAEVDFPSGIQLARSIGKKMDVRFEHGFKPIGDGDHDLYSHIVHSLPQERQQYQQAGWRIRDGIAFSQSIDDFLDQHRNDQYVNLYGKAAIVQTVAEAERNSRLFFDRHQGVETLDPDKLVDTWFVKFFYMLSRGIDRDNVREIFDQVAFVIFNYDRCVEHFLINALQRSYSISFNDAVAIVADLHIVHPYGVIGDLSKVPFGATRINCVALTKGIKTYTEQIADAEIKTE